MVAAPKSSPRKFLIVDDDAAFRTRLVKAIESRGLQAFGAASPEEAVALARRHSAEAAVVDLRMLGASGLDVVRDLVALDTGMQVVVLTGYGSIASAVEAVRRGAIN